MRINHNRLSRPESILMRAAFAIVFATAGFVVLVGVLVGVADAMTPDVIPGKAVTVESDPSVCGRIDWHETDLDGRRFTPFDANRDGMIDCESDIELGA